MVVKPRVRTLRSVLSRRGDFVTLVFTVVPRSVETFSPDTNGVREVEPGVLPVRTSPVSTMKRLPRTPTDSNIVGVSHHSTLLR